MKHLPFLIFICIFLSACQRRTSPQDPNPPFTLPHPQTDQASSTICFAGLTVQNITTSQQVLDQKSALIAKETQKNCVNIQKQLQNRINLTVKVLIATHSLDARKLKVLIKPIEEELNQVMSHFTLKKEARKKLTAKALVNIEQQIFQQVEQTMKDKLLTTQNTLEKQASALNQEVMEIRSSGRKKILINKQIERLYHIDSKDIEVDKVLDLTKQDTRDLFKLTRKKIATKIDDAVDAYTIPQIIGHIAKRKGFKGIKAPSAPDKNGQNLVLFKELK